MNLIMVSAFVLYFALLTLIGLFFYKKNRSASDFILGNRSVNYWVTAIATQASDMGGWIFLGLPALVYTRGLIEAWTAVGLAVGMFLTWQFIAQPLRISTANLNSLTLPSYFAHRYNDSSSTFQVVSSSLSLLFFTFYITSGLVGLSLLFESSLGVPYYIGMSLSLVTAALYALIGGFVAIAWCDFFQGMFLFFMIVLVPVCAFLQLPDNIETILSAAQLAGKSLSPFGSVHTMAYAIMLAAGWGLGYFGQPHILINFMGIDDPKKLSSAKIIGMCWQVIVLTASVCIGVVGIGFFNNTLANPQLVFVTMTTTLFHPFFAGLVLCAIIAATLSTIDTLILAAGATIAEDLYRPLVSKNASSHQLLWVSRIGSVSISLIALAIAWQNTQSIYNLVNYAWAGLGSSFGPLVIMSLYYPKTTRHGALTGMIIGGLVAALWPYELPLVPGFFTGLATIFAVSQITRK